MNRRRALLLALSAVPITLARAQPINPGGRLARVALLGAGSAKQAQRGQMLFLEILQKLGWTEGRSIVYDRAYADGNETRLPALASALAGRRPDVIHVMTNPGLRAVLASTRAIPIVFANVSLPVENGFVESLRHPGGNTTGVASIGWALGGKRMELLREVLPDIGRVGVFYSPHHPSSRAERELIERAAGANVRLKWLFSHQPVDLDAAFAAARGSVDALLATQIPLFNRERKRLLEFSASQHLPLIGTQPLHAEGGALMAYSVVVGEEIRRSAYLVDKVLRGTRPAEIPVEEPTKFELVVNLRAARTLGIAVPGAVLLRATRVIE